MDFDDENPDLRSAHVIVVGNEKGGAGKSTLSIHIAVALLKSGHKVACIDLDTRQQTLTRFFENRASWSQRTPPGPSNCRAIAPWRAARPRTCAPTRPQEFAAFAQAISDVEHDYEFVVIDTPASDSYLMRLAHSLADTLVSPLNDSVTSTSTCSAASITTATGAAASPITPISCCKPAASAASSTTA